MERVIGGPLTSPDLLSDVIIDRGLIDKIHLILPKSSEVPVYSRLITSFMLCYPIGEVYLLI